MKKLFGVMLLACAANVNAAWIQYGDNGKAEFYYDDATIMVKGNLVTVWEMLNYSFSLKGVMSNRALKEYDCAQSRFRTLEGEFFSGQRLAGDKVSSNVDPDDPWRAIVPGTRNEELMDLVCGKRS
jgi:hypothetical protein